MTKEELFLVFDMDGVIVDTVNQLYLIYLRFLKDFGHVGSKEEFDCLNGPKISEIVAFLKSKYQLRLSEEEMLEKYNTLILEMYDKVKLSPGIKEILRRLKEDKVKIALASSAKMFQINKVLDRFDLKNYFELIISGDDVKSAKPSPEIYHKIREIKGDYEYYVVEDSENGIKSAIAAKMKVIKYKPEESKINDNKDQSNVSIENIISHLNQLDHIRLEKIKKIKIIEKSKEAEIHLDLVDNRLNLSPKELDQIEGTWLSEKAKNPSLFNGKIVCYLSHEINESKIIIKCFISEYKLFLAKNKLKDLKINIKPIGISGLVIDKENNVLIAKRKNVTEYNNFYEFPPSGSIEVSSNNIIIEPRKQILKELKEETGIEKIDKIVDLAFTFDKNDEVYDICFLIKVENINRIVSKEDNSEYNQFQVINIKELEDKINVLPFVNTSLAIYSIFKQVHHH